MPSLLTWRLWRALRNPAEENPLFARVQAQPIDLPGKRLLRRFAPIYPLITVVLPALFVVIAPVALWIASNVLGALIAFNIMSTITREREQRTYDLLALMPIGRGATNWLIAAACTQRVDAIDRMAHFRTLAIIALLLLMFLLPGGLLALVSVLAILLVLNLDAVQSLIIGCLSGMLAQEFSEQGAPFIAVAIFAFIQIIVVYLPVSAAAILLLDGLRPAQLSLAATNTLLVTLVLGLLFALREMIIQIMWHELERRLL